MVKARLGGLIKGVDWVERPLVRIEFSAKKPRARDRRRRFYRFNAGNAQVDEGGKGAVEGGGT